MGNVTTIDQHPFCSLLNGCKESPDLISPKNCSLCKAYHTLQHDCINGRYPVCPQLTVREQVNHWKYKFFIDTTPCTYSRNEKIKISCDFLSPNFGIDIPKHVDASYTVDDILYELLSRTVCSHTCPCEMKTKLIPRDPIDLQKSGIRLSEVMCPSNGMIYVGKTSESEIIGKVHTHYPKYTKRTHHETPHPYDLQVRCDNETSMDKVFLTTFDCALSGTKITHSLSSISNDGTNFPVDIWKIITQYADVKKHGIMVYHDTLCYAIYGEICNVCCAVEKCLHNWTTNSRANCSRSVTIDRGLAPCAARSLYSKCDRLVDVKMMYKKWIDECKIVETVDSIEFEFGRVILLKAEIRGDIKNIATGVIDAVYKKRKCKCDFCMLLILYFIREDKKISFKEFVDEKMKNVEQMEALRKRFGEISDADNF